MFNKREGEFSHSISITGCFILLRASVIPVPAGGGRGGALDFAV